MNQRENGLDDANFACSRSSRRTPASRSPSWAGGWACRRRPWPSGWPAGGRRRDQGLSRRGRPARARLHARRDVRIRPAPRELHKVAELAQRTPEVVECHRITGEDCYFMKAWVRDVEHLEEVIDQFAIYGQTTTSIMQKSPVPPRPRRRGGRSSARPRKRQTEQPRAVREELVEAQVGGLQLALDRLARELGADLGADLLAVGEGDLQVGARRSAPAERRSRAGASRSTSWPRRRTRRARTPPGRSRRRARS